MNVDTISQTSHHTDLFCDEPDEPPQQNFLPDGHEITNDTEEYGYNANSINSNINYNNQQEKQPTTLKVYSVDNQKDQIINKNNNNTNNLSSFKIYARTITGKTITIPNVSSLTTIAELKQIILNMEGIPAEQQRLIFTGKNLEDEKRLSDYKIKDGNVINLVLRLRNTPDAINTSITNLSNENELVPAAGVSNIPLGEEGMLKMMMGATACIVCCVLCCVIPILCAVDFAALAISSSYDDSCLNEHSYVVDLRLFLNVGAGFALASYAVLFPMTFYIIKKITMSLIDNDGNNRAPNPAMFLDLNSIGFIIFTLFCMCVNLFLLSWSIIGMYIYGAQLSDDCKSAVIGEIIIAWSVIRFILAICAFVQQGQQRHQLRQLQSVE